MHERDYSKYLNLDTDKNYVLLDTGEIKPYDTKIMGFTRSCRQEPERHVHINRETCFIYRGREYEYSLSLNGSGMHAFQLIMADEELARRLFIQFGTCVLMKWPID